MLVHFWESLLYTSSTCAFWRVWMEKCLSIVWVCAYLHLSATLCERIGGYKLQAAEWALGAMCWAVPPSEYKAGPHFHILKILCFLSTFSSFCCVSAMGAVCVVCCVVPLAENIAGLLSYNEFVMCVFIISLLSAYSKCVFILSLLSVCVRCLSKFQLP